MSGVCVSVYACAHTFCDREGSKNVCIHVESVCVQYVCLGQWRPGHVFACCHHCVPVLLVMCLALDGPPQA